MPIAPNILTHMKALSTFEDNPSPNISFIIASLDWSLFDQQTDASILDVLLPPQLRRDQFDVIFGSALCYTTGHSCLAYLIGYYLSGRCREVIVIQIKDREGFAELMLELEKMSLTFTLEDISEDIWDDSQFISYQKGVMVEQRGECSKQLLYYSFPPSHSDHRGEKSGLIRSDRQVFGLLRVLA